MNPWFGRVAFLPGLIAMIAIRVPYGRSCAELEVVESQKGRREIALLALMWITTTILPLISIVTPLLWFADYPLHRIPFFLGTACLLSGLWLFRRSPVDLVKGRLMARLRTEAEGALALRCDLSIGISYCRSRTHRTIDSGKVCLPNRGRVTWTARRSDLATRITGPLHIEFSTIERASDIRGIGIHPGASEAPP